MQFHFQQPVMWGGRLGAEIDMMAELSGSPGDFHVDAFYAFELAPGGPRYEIARHSYEFALAELYIRSNPQELERIADEWPDDVPRRRSVGNEHSTYAGRP